MVVRALREFDAVVFVHACEKHMAGTSLPHAHVAVSRAPWNVAYFGSSGRHASSEACLPAVRSDGTPSGDVSEHSWADHP